MMAFMGFLTAMLVVYLVAQEVMAVLECIGFASGISEAMLGITLLAWGNSVGGKYTFSHLMVYNIRINVVCLCVCEILSICYAIYRNYTWLSKGFWF